MHAHTTWFRLIEVALAVFLASQAAAGELSRDSIDNLMKMKAEILESLGSPSNIHEQEGKDRAGRIMERINSGEYQDRLRAETERLKTTVFQDQLSSLSTGSSIPGLPGGSGKLSPDERLYVFVSSSMPVNTLRNYAADIDRIKDPNVMMVMRGFVGGMKEWGKMLDFSSRVLSRDPSCDAMQEQCDLYRANLQVDPLLFRRYGVSAVPTVVYARGVQRLDAALSEGLPDIATVSGSYSIRGDLSLAYILDVIRSETSSPSIDAVLAALRENHDDGGEDGK